MRIFRWSGLMALPFVIVLAGYFLVETGAVADDSTRGVELGNIPATGQL